MSSILKALQKVENRDPEEGYVLTWRLRQNRTGSLSLRIKILKIVGQIATAILAAAFVIAAGWFVLTRNPELANRFIPGLIATEQHTPPQQERAAVPPLSPAGARPVPAPPSDSEPESVSRRQADSIQPDILQNKDTVIERDIGDESASLAEIDISPAGEARETIVDPVTGGEIAKTDILKDGRRDAAGEPSASPSSVKLNDDAPAGLKLQALAWADDPGKRVALINDIVVKKGRYVKGYKVTHIGKDHVVVKSGGSQWTLRFESE